MIRVSDSLSGRRPHIVAALCLLVLPHLAYGQSGSALPVPEYYGIYATTDGHLVKLDGKEVKTDRSVSVPMGQRQSVGGVINGTPVASSQPAAVPVFGPDMKIIVFMDGHGIMSPLQMSQPLRMEPLLYIRNVSVDTGFPNNIRRSGPENGWEYGNAPDMLGFATGDHPESLELLKKPFPGHEDMLIAGFAEPLKPGVYRLTLRPGSPPFDAGTYFTFAVEPVADAQVSKCADATVTYAMAVSNMKFRACDSSATAPSGTTPSAAAPRAAPSSVNCADYQACRRAGSAAMQTSNWQEALAYFEAAHAKEPDRGGAWSDIGDAYMALGRYDDVPSAWDKALRSDQPFGVGACHERGMQSCEQGILWLTPTQVFFRAGNRKIIFTGAPADVSIKKQTDHAAGGHVSLTLEVGGKNYQLDFIPTGFQCQINLFANCSADGAARQTVIGNYIAAAIPKLAAGLKSDK